MPTYHVYADANVFLDFFRFSDDDLGELEKLFQHIDDGHITLYLPQLTSEEYFRNRDKVVLEQLQELKRPPLKVGIPIFIRDLEKSKAFQDSLASALAARNELLSEVEAQAASRSFKADEIIRAIFSKAKFIPTLAYLMGRARERLGVGNPPGKPGSLGDRLNWESLLDEVPGNNDLHLITRDGDYISSFPERSPTMFLVEEWSRVKTGKIELYTGIKSFAKRVDDSLIFVSEIDEPFPSSPDRTKTIEDLACSGSYAQTHASIANLVQYLSELSPAELEQLLEIAMTNGQVGGIMGDDDVESFYTKVRQKMPWAGNVVADRFDEIFGALSVPF